MHAKLERDTNTQWKGQEGDICSYGLLIQPALHKNRSVSAWLRSDWASGQPTVGLSVSRGLTTEAYTDMATVASGLGPNLTMASMLALVSGGLLHLQVALLALASTARDGRISNF